MKIRGNERGRPAFTLIELLVVIAIIGVMLALAVGVVQRVRDAAYRVQCADHLRQIGLGLHGYHDLEGSFPSGVKDNPPPRNEPYPWLSWRGRILPFMDQRPLWDATQQAYLAGVAFYHDPPHVGLGTVLPVYTCPADVRALYPVSVVFGEGSPPFVMKQVGTSSFLGVAGTDYLHLDGCLFLNSAIRFADIKDGTSNTLLVGERPPRADLSFGWWYAQFGQKSDGSADSVLGVTELKTSAFLPACSSSEPSAFGPGRIDSDCDVLHYWSLHTGGANFLLADGSVHFFSYSASSVMASLATRAGGETLSEQAY